VGRNLHNPLKRAVESLRDLFPGKSYSWIRRAVLRLGDIKEVREDLYVVYGRRELGDWKPLYQVWFSEREGRWLCTCYFNQFGFRRRKEICTHVAAVMLFRRYRRAVERAENRRVYVAELEVECPGRLDATGELYVKPVVETTGNVAKLTSFARPRYRVVVVSAFRRIVVRCAGYVVLEAEGEEVPLAVARYLVERLREEK